MFFGREAYIAFIAALVAGFFRGPRYGLAVYAVFLTAAIFLLCIPTLCVEVIFAQTISFRASRGFNAAS